MGASRAPCSIGSLDGSSDPRGYRRARWPCHSPVKCVRTPPPGGRANPTALHCAAMSGEVVFIADAHLGAESGEREATRTALLHQFLDELPGRAERLVIAGDLFDFWFEYRTAIPRRHFATLAALRRAH